MVGDIGGLGLNKIILVYGKLEEILVFVIFLLKGGSDIFRFF